MLQIALPLIAPAEEPAASPSVTDGSKSENKNRVNSQDDCQSFEEKYVRTSVAKNAEPMVHKAVANHFQSQTGTFTNEQRTWPAGLTLRDAMAYSSLSAAIFRRWEREGALTVRRAGRNGAKVVLRSELDSLLESFFDVKSDKDISEDFDFG